MGEYAFGFGSSVNNQCVPGPGGFGTPTLPSMGGESPIEIYPLTNDEGHWRVKKWPSALFEDLIYYNEIDKRCVGNSSGVVHQEGFVYAYCQDKCLERNAIIFATMLHLLCKNPNTGQYECDVYAAALPKNRWQAIHERDHWGAVVKWDCAQDWQSPLVRCLCRKKLWGISAKEVNDCLEDLLGAEVERCSWAGGGGGGDGEPSKESILECLRRVADKWSKLGVNIDFVIDWLVDCVEQAFVFFLACLAIGEKREVCLSQLRTQLRDCLDNAPTGLLEQYRDEILEDIRNCFVGAM